MARTLTSREALIAELLGDVEHLVTRLEALPVLVAGAEAQLSASALALSDAGDNYRLAVTRFTEEAKANLTQYVQQKAASAMRDAAPGRVTDPVYKVGSGGKDNLRAIAASLKALASARPAVSFPPTAGLALCLGSAVLASGMMACVLHIFFYPYCR